MENRKNQIQCLAVSSVLIALASVLSLIKLPLPIFLLGGSITLLSMLPIVMIGVMYGVKWGLGSAFAYSIIQLIFGITMEGVLGWGLSPQALIGCILLDYIVAFTLLGLAGSFRQKGHIGICIGTAMVLIFRFLAHFVSGILIFGSIVDKGAWIHSLTYNGAYMLPELILTVTGAAIVFTLPQIKSLVERR